MVSLKVYSWEVFERSIRWYICFTVVIISVVCLSLFYEPWDHLEWLIGAIVLLMIVWGYLFFLSKANSEIKMIIKPEWLTVWNRLISYSELNWFVVEMDKKTWELRNIVLVYDKFVEIYTLKDTKKQQQLFFSKLSELIPFLEKYNQSWFEKFMRKIKL